MTQAIAPGDIEVDHRVVFKEPYDQLQVFNMKLKNTSNRPIGYVIKSSSPSRIAVSPSHGVLDLDVEVQLDVSCDAFEFGQEETKNDHITVEWTNTPNGTAKQFRRKWFEGEGLIRKKRIRIKYEKKEIIDGPVQIIMESETTMTTIRIGQLHGVLSVAGNVRVVYQ